MSFARAPDQIQGPAAPALITSTPLRRHSRSSSPSSSSKKARKHSKRRDWLERPVCNLSIMFSPDPRYGNLPNKVKTGEKTCTRRLWSLQHASKYRNRIGYIFWAVSGYSKGTRFGRVLLTDMYQEALQDTPLEDIRAEGFPSLTRQQFEALPAFNGCSQTTILWVLRFKYVPCLTPWHPDHYSNAMPICFYIVGDM